MRGHNKNEDAGDSTPTRSPKPPPLHQKFKMEGLGYSYITTTHPASTTIGPRSPSPWISCLHRGSSRHLQSVWGRDVASILVAVVGGAQRRGYGAKHTTCPGIFRGDRPNQKNHFLPEEDWLYTRLRRPHRNPSCRHLFLLSPNTKNVASLAAFFVSEFQCCAGCVTVLKVANCHRL